MKNKKNDSFLLIFKTITNIAFYLSAIFGVFLVVVLIAFIVIPDHFQGKIFLPVNLDINDVNVTASQVRSIDNLGRKNITAFRITYLTKNLSIIRLLLLYYFIIILGVLTALFFWKKILTSYQKSTFFSQENRTIVNCLGWLLIFYFPFFYLINLFFETLINLQIGNVLVSPSVCQVLDVGIILVALGSMVLFIGKIVNKGIS
jgi:hypothetical protein